MLYAVIDFTVEAFLLVGKVVTRGVSYLIFGRQESDMERIERILSEMQIELVEIEKRLPSENEAKEPENKLEKL